MFPVRVSEDNTPSEYILIPEPVELVPERTKFLSDVSSTTPFQRTVGALVPVAVIAAALVPTELLEPVMPRLGT